eukprot:snap_masked-scaffold_14-processed-gene-0.34-mRNA-1 protein AED:1.00 eAED:1.00 QI:0/-1/0/0/-1/1/1/0/99
MNFEERPEKEFKNRTISSLKNFPHQHSGPVKNILVREKQLTMSPVSRRKRDKKWYTHFHDDDNLEEVKVSKECGEQVKQKSDTGNGAFKIMSLKSARKH